MTALVMLLALAFFTVSAGVALAATLSGDGTIIGTTGNDTINAGSLNDTIYGLGGSDNISAGGGNDMIDGGGACMAGVQSGVYANGLPASEYCQDGPARPYGTDNISAGGGNDVVWGNGGANSINLGGGNDTVYAYGGPNNVSVGNGGDKVYAYGTGSYSVGTGYSTVYAQYSTGDTINCGSKRTTVYAVKGADKISSMCTVIYVSAARAPSVTHRFKKHHRRHQVKAHVVSA